MRSHQKTKEDPKDGPLTWLTQWPSCLHVLLLTSFGKLAALHTELCNVPKKANETFATTDACPVFDTDGHTLQESTKSPEANVHMQIPHRDHRRCLRVFAEDITVLLMGKSRSGRDDKEGDEEVKISC